MKNLILLLAFFSISNFLLAQTENKKEEIKTNYVQSIVEVATKYTNRIYTTIGSAYQADDLSIMPTRNINKIAGITMGVNSFNGATPVFKGCTDGTAYFVDGIRVRSGALGIAGYTW